MTRTRDHFQALVLVKCVSTLSGILTFTSYGSPTLLTPTNSQMSQYFYFEKQFNKFD